ncbi:MAG: hypothetical protein GY769_14285 [bacterium]|nr:hypothetical protein [bacterium]
MRRPGAFLSALVLTAAPGASTLASAEAEITGFVQANYAARLPGAPCASETACDFPLGEERVQLKIEGFSEDGSAGFVGKADLFHDAVLNESEVEIREAFVDLLGRYFSLRAGRQIVTWGVGDLLFINDTFPKDWIAFFTGRPLQYLKIGSDALKIELHPRSLSVEIVVVPFFQSDRLPTGERLLVANPFPSGLPRRESTPERSLENTELSAKLSRYIGAWELAAYVSRTHYRSPATTLDQSMDPGEIQLFFPRLNTYGGSLAGGLGSGVFSLEMGYYDSVEDTEGTNPAVENSQFKGLMGYTRPLWADASLGLQVFGEWMQDHDAYRSTLPAGSPVRDRPRWTATTRFTQLLYHQTLTLSLFAFWGLSEQDAYLIPSVRYAFTDSLWGEFGANLFSGEESHTMFGGLDTNDNLYLTARYSF